MVDTFRPAGARRGRSGRRRRPVRLVVERGPAHRLRRRRLLHRLDSHAHHPTAPHRLSTLVAHRLSVITSVPFCLTVPPSVVEDHAGRTHAAPASLPASPASAPETGGNVSDKSTTVSTSPGIGRALAARDARAGRRRRRRRSLPRARRPRGGSPGRGPDRGRHDLPADGDGHDGHPRQRLQLGLLQGRRVRRQRAQRHRPGQDRDAGQGRCARSGAPPARLLLDAGDTIQGTPLAYYYAKIDPITGGSMHPMATAMNAIGYDAAALGNHEFNYGLETLRAFESQCDFPLLGANSVDWDTGAPAFPPLRHQAASRCPAWPGRSRSASSAWSPRASPSGTRPTSRARCASRGIVEQAKVWVPRLKQAGCDLVIVSCHSGATPGSSYGDALPFPENASTPAGRSRSPASTPSSSGTPTRRSPSASWPTRSHRQEGPAHRAAQVGHAPVGDGPRPGAGHGRWTVAHGARARCSTPTPSPRTPTVADLLREDHAVVRTYVNSVIGTCTAAMSAATARFEDTAAIDFINHVQADAVKTALAGTPDASAAGAVDRRAVQPRRRHPRRQRHGARRRGPLHLRQHAARHPVHRRRRSRPTSSSPRATSSRSTAAGPTRPTTSPTPSARDRRRTARPTTTTTSWAASTPRWPTTSTSRRPAGSASPT